MARRPVKGILDQALLRSSTVVLDPNKVYIAQYNPCTYESSFGSISIHRTLQGAYDAMEAHKKKTLEMYPDDYKVEDWEVWRVVETKVQE